MKKGADTVLRVGRSQLGTIALMTILAHGLALNAYADEGGELPSPPGPQPAHYGVHLSKAERRGKSPAELQALRAQGLAHG